MPPPHPRPRPGRRRPRRLLVGFVLAGLAAVLTVSAAPGALAAPLPAPQTSPLPGQGPAPIVPGTPTRTAPPTPSTGGGGQSGSPTPSPSPTSSPGIGSAGGGHGGGIVPGWLSGLTDIPGKIAGAIDRWLAKLVEAALKPVMNLLVNTVLSTEDVTTRPQIRQMWWGSVAIADSLMLLVLTIGGVTAMGYDTVQTRAAAKELAPRMVVGFLLAHLSLPLMSLAIGLANGITKAIASGQITPQGMGQLLTTLLLINEIDPFMTIIELCVAAMAVALVVGWLVRLLVLMTLAVAGPLLLIWHGLPQTAGVARLYWRALAGCLAIQIGHSLLLLIGLRILLENNDPGLGLGKSSLLNILICCALFLTALRLQGWVVRLVLQSTGSGQSTVMTLVKYQVLRKAVTAAGVVL